MEFSYLLPNKKNYKGSRKNKTDRIEKAKMVCYYDLKNKIKK